MSYTTQDSTVQHNTHADTYRNTAADCAIPAILQPPHLLVAQSPLTPEHSSLHHERSCLHHGVGNKFLLLCSSIHAKSLGTVPTLRTEHYNKSLKTQCTQLE
eukprot:gene509-3835_t